MWESTLKNMSELMIRAEFYNKLINTTSKNPDNDWEMNHSEENLNLGNEGKDILSHLIILKLIS